MVLESEILGYIKDNPGINISSINVRHYGKYADSQGWIDIACIIFKLIAKEQIIVKCSDKTYLDCRFFLK